MEQVTKKQKINNIDSEIEYYICFIKNKINEGVYGHFDLLRVLDIFNNYKNNEEIRIQSLDYFNKYHSYGNAYQNFYDKDIYIKFITEIFFDPSFEVFSKLKGAIRFDFLQRFCNDFFNSITFDERMIPWFKENYERDPFELETKFLLVNLFNSHQNTFFSEGLNKWVKVSYTNEEFKTIFNIKDFLNFINPNPVLNKKPIYFQDLLIKKILNYVFDLIEEDGLPKFLTDILYVKKMSVNQLLNFALVNKKFFKISKERFENSNYTWTELSIRNTILSFDSNYNSQFNLYSKPPLFFDQQSIIRVVQSKCNIDEFSKLFSRVQTYLGDYLLCSKEELGCRIGVNNLISVPPMPSLKNINILLFKLGYLYFNIVDNLVASNLERGNPNSIISSTYKATNYIENFNMEISDIPFDSDSDDEYDSDNDYDQEDFDSSCFSFFENLLKNHSSSLKKITIHLHFCHEKELAIWLIQTFEDILGPNENNIVFKLYIHGYKLEVWDESYITEEENSIFKNFIEKQNLIKKI